MPLWRGSDLTHALLACFSRLQTLTKHAMEQCGGHRPKFIIDTGRNGNDKVRRACTRSSLPHSADATLPLIS